MFNASLKKKLSKFQREWFCFDAQSKNMCFRLNWCGSNNNFSMKIWKIKYLKYNWKIWIKNIFKKYSDYSFK